MLVELMPVELMPVELIPVKLIPVELTPAELMPVELAYPFRSFLVFLFIKKKQEAVNGLLKRYIVTFPQF